MKAEKVREMGADELSSRERELQEQLFRLRLQQSLGQLDNPLKIRETRRDIARLKTERRSREKKARLRPGRAGRPWQSRRSRIQTRGRYCISS